LCSPHVAARQRYQIVGFLTSEKLCYLANFLLIGSPSTRAKKEPAARGVKNLPFGGWLGSPMIAMSPSPLFFA
jgi:hypothetical protein